MSITFWAYLTILFILFRMIPGDPVTMFVPSGGIDAETRQEMLRNMGLNDPLHVQYLKYLGDMVQGDFGQSFIHNEPVLDIITVKLWNTLTLMGGAMIIAFTGAIVIGSYLAWKRGTKTEGIGVILTLIVRSSPIFWIAIVFIIIFSFHLNLFPTGGIRTPTRIIDGFWDRYLSWDFVHHVALPMSVAALYYMSTPLLLMRNTMIEVLNADFIEAKRTMGLSRFRILYKHAARNSILPIVTIAALAAGRALGGQLVLEVVFGWPGMGRAMVDAVYNHDYPIAQAAFFLMGGFVILLNFVADLLYGYLDPRVSYD